MTSFGITVASWLTKADVCMVHPMHAGACTGQLACGLHEGMQPASAIVSLALLPLLDLQHA